MRRLLHLALAALLLVLVGCSDDGAGDDGPLTVEQLVDRQPDDVVVVRGFLLADDIGPRMCAAILESFPPQCGEPAVFLVDLDLNAVGEVETAEGVAWREDTQLTVQRIDDQTYRVVQG